MTKNRGVFLICLIGYLSYFGVIPVIGSTNISGIITQSTTWTSAGSPYILSGEVRVQSTTISDIAVLTIQSGVQIKFDAGAWLHIGGTSSTQRGALTATGIKFTSNQLSPVAGDWGSIYFDAYSEDTLCTLSRSIIEYGTYGVYCANAGPTLSYCTISHNQNNGIYVGIKRYPVIQRSLFSANNNYPISAPAEGIRKIVQCVFVGNTRQGIETRAGIMVTSGTWSNQGVPYVINGLVSVYANGNGGILTLPSGVVLKFATASSGFHIAGTSTTQTGGLIATGVTFTSINDDAVGGDTYGDGTTTIPTWNSWGNLYFDRYTLATTKLDQCIIRYGGYNSEGLIIVDGSSPIFSYCTISYSIPSGIYGTNQGYPTVSECSIANIGGYPISIEAEGIRKITGTIIDNNERQGIEARVDTIVTSCTWQDLGIPYVINGLVSIYTSGDGSMLTLSPGMILKFANNSSELHIAGNDSTQIGGLIATGVTFTSLKDDSIGGDTYGDGTATSPNPNGRDWRRIYFDQYTIASSELDHCVVRYAGATYSEAIYVNGSSPTFSYCTVTSNGGVGIYGANHGYPTISDCDISYNAQAPITVQAEGVRNISDCTFTNNQYQGIFVNNDVVVTSCTWTNQGIPYVVYGLSVYSTGVGSVLTLEPGVIIKVYNGTNLQIGSNNSTYRGGLIATGVIFTSRYDDSVGGDTFGDGTATSPAPGDWYNINFGDYITPGTGLTQCIIRYAGESGYTAVGVRGSSPTFTLCTIANNAGLGIYGSLAGYPVLSNCLFDSNGNYPISLEAEGIRNISGCTFSNNTRQGIEVRSSNIYTSCSWSNPGIPYVINGIVEVYSASPGCVLNLNPGVILKFANNYSELDIAGNDSIHVGGLNATGVTFTSLKDDSVGGDTYGDGTITSPAPGDYEGINYYNFTLASTKLDKCIIGYGGYSNLGQIITNGCAPTFTRCTIADSKSIGIYGMNFGYPTVTDCRFISNQGFPISIQAEGIRKVTGSSFSNNKQRAIEARDDIIVTSCTWINQGAPYVINQNVSIYTSGSGAILTLTPGVVMKFYDLYSQLNIGGSNSEQKGGLVATGVTFTSLKDDAVGGDTNGDSTTSSPRAGDWDTLYFDKFSLATTKLDRCVVRYGSYSYPGEIEVDGCFPIFSYCTVNNSKGYGILGLNHAYPVINGCKFQGNQDFPISLEAEGIRNITGNSFSGNKRQGIEVKDDIVVTTCTWENQGVPYVINHNISIYTSGNGATLTLDTGLVLKFYDVFSQINIGGKSSSQRGGLIATGVTFTTLKDDSIGGDTYGDGTATIPESGDWQTLNFWKYTTSSTKLDRCTIRYGAYPYANPAELYVSGCAPTFSNCTLNYCASHGIYALNKGYPIISGCVFQNNQDYPISVEAEGIRNVTSNSISNNNSRPAIEARADALVTSCAWTNQGVPYVIKGYISVYTTGAGCILTLNPGVVIKFTDIASYFDIGSNNVGLYGGLVAQGNGYAPIYFTSLYDDSIGGDTFGDGSTTQPTSGNWRCIYFRNNTLPGSILDHCIVRYGGSSDGNIYCYNNAQPTIRYCLIEKSANKAINCNGATPYLHHNTIQDNAQYGIYLLNNTIPPSIENNNIVQNPIGLLSQASTSVIFKYNNISNNTTGVSNSRAAYILNGEFNWWGDTTGPFDDSNIGIYNPDGKGNRVSDYIDYTPWLGENPEQPRRLPDIKFVKGDWKTDMFDLGRYMLDTAASWTWSTNRSVDQARIVINPENTVDYTPPRTAGFIGLDSVAFCANWYAQATSILKYSTYIFNRMGDTLIDNGNEVENCWLNLNNSIIKNGGDSYPTIYKSTIKYDDAADAGKLSVTISGSTAEIIPSSTLKSPATVIFTVQKDSTGTDFDKQLLRVYEIVNSNGHFGVASDTTKWYFQVYADGSGPGTLSWVTGYSDGSGLAKITQAAGQKGKLSQMFTVAKPGWYTARARVATDIILASKQQKVYLYLQEYNSANQIVEVANQVLSSGAGAFVGPGAYRDLEISYYAKGTSLGVQLVAINPSGSGITGSIYVDTIWVYPGVPQVTRCAGATQVDIVNSSFDITTSGWLVQVYADGTGPGTWNWDTGWAGRTGLLKVNQSGGQKGKASQTFLFPNPGYNALASVWVYSGATSTANSQKVYLYLYSYDTSYGTIIESGNAILQPGQWAPNQWRELKFGYNPLTNTNAVQVVAINQAGKPAANIYFDDISVNQDQDLIYYWDHTLF